MIILKVLNEGKWKKQLFGLALVISVSSVLKRLKLHCQKSATYFFSIPKD